MESEKFNKQISEALRQMQPQQPADMTERFMERLRREGLPAQSITKPKPKPKRTARWISLSAVAAAAAVLLLVFLPTKQKPALPAAPQLAQSEAPQTATSTATVPTPTPSASPVVPAASRESPDTPDSPEIPENPEAPENPETLETPESLEAPAASTASAPSAALTAVVPSVATVSQPQPAFTDEERRLMERAEEMRPQALLYAAEILQCARIEARERQQALFARQETSDQKQIITSI
ncbi:MAG: hypothetical protein IJ659_00985 [Alloprevotella sp.]|nr:hypothetical protein [Alloprevotella sp.]